MEETTQKADYAAGCYFFPVCCVDAGEYTADESGKTKGRLDMQATGYGSNPASGIYMMCSL